ncbi:MAG TPA: hypothetical protein VER03_07810 [Bryobacteraceae bacterium]|nr:hypothetical protein [Bryobacteraceae bacterium]
MQTSTFKTSTIFVATAKRTRVFQSMDEMPVDVRRRISEQLSGPNTRTLIVADRRGREYLLKVLQRATNSSASLTGASAAETPKPLRQFSVLWGKAKRYWLEVGLIALLGASGWALFAWK